MNGAWLVIAILFAAGEPVDSRIFKAEDLKACKEARAELQKRVKEKNVDMWLSECIEVKRDKFHKDRDS